jgi:hypothetical protein
LALATHPCSSFYLPTMTHDDRLENKKPNLLFNKEKRQQVKADTKAKPAYLNQRNLVSHFFFGPYALLPVISALVWLGGLLALLGLWVSQGKPRYRGDEASVVFVSDGEFVGAKIALAHSSIADRYLSSLLSSL